MNSKCIESDPIRTPFVDEDYSVTTKTPFAAYCARALLAGAALVLTGCVGIHTHSSEGKELVMSRAEFGAYVERVFRYHNQVVENLIQTPEADDSDRVAELEEAEARMNEICDPLNETVSQEIAGNNPNLKLSSKLMDAVPACEAATKAVDQLSKR